MPNSESGIRKAECGKWNTDSGIQNAKCGMRNAESQMPIGPRNKVSSAGATEVLAAGATIVFAAGANDTFSSVEAKKKPFLQRLTA